MKVLLLDLQRENEYILYRKTRRFFFPPEGELNHSLLGRTLGNYTGRELRRKMSNCDPLKVFVFVFPLLLLDVTDTYRELFVFGEDQVFM